MVPGVGSRMAISIATMLCAVSLLLSGCAILEPEGSEKWQQAQRSVLEDKVLQENMAGRNNRLACQAQVLGGEIDFTADNREVMILLPPRRAGSWIIQSLRVIESMNTPPPRGSVP